MSEAALERAIAASEALVRALDSGDQDAIERDTQQLREALASLSAAGGWRVRPDLRARVVHAMKTADAARGRINYLADHNRRRLDRLSTLTGGGQATRYGRGGRYN